MGQRQIAVYGATKRTGRRVAQALARRTDLFVIAGPDQAALEALALELEDSGGAPNIVVASLDNPRQLDAMLAQVGVVINCFGDFLSQGRPIVEAALRKDTHYLDTAAEQDHIRWVSDACEDHQTRCVLVPSCAFRFALGDLASEIALANAASRIVVAYAVPDAKMGFGTRKSLVRILTEGGITFVDGEQIERHAGVRLFDVPFPDGKTKKGVWIAGGEAITVPRRGGVSTVETCLAAAEGAETFSMPLLRLVPSLLRGLQPFMDKVTTTKGESAKDNDGRRDFLVIAFDPKTTKPHVILRGADPYGMTTRIVTETALRLANKDPIREGFLGLADLVKPRDFLAAIGVEICEFK